MPGGVIGAYPAGGAPDVVSRDTCEVATFTSLKGIVSSEYSAVIGVNEGARSGCLPYGRRH